MLLQITWEPGVSLTISREVTPQMKKKKKKAIAHWKILNTETLRQRQEDDSTPPVSRLKLETPLYFLAGQV